MVEDEDAEDHHDEDGNEVDEVPGTYREIHHNSNRRWERPQTRNL